MRSRTTPALLALVLAPFGGCPQDNQQNDGTCDPTAPECPEGQVCESTLGGDARCAGPLMIRGMVFDITTQEPIQDALVQAADINGAAVGTTGQTDEAGNYTLIVPATRDPNGVPADGIYTLRVQAQTYQEFPTAIRPALPLDAETATQEDDTWVIENSLTTVALIPLPGDTSQLGSIQGAISADLNAGVLVVAEGQSDTLTGFSDSDGNYTIFNVPAGSYTIQGYFAGLQLVAVQTSLTAGELKTGIDLSQADRPLSTVSGDVQIVNAPGDSQTSVILAVESTFIDAAGRGKVPPGLRVGGITGAFTIKDVPDGRYVVLAAFENDMLVRDPDLSISGTAVVRITVPDPTLGNTITFSEGFKVTEALNVVRPGADQPQEVATATPTLEWEDDSSEDRYIIRVFDSFGELVWDDEIGPVTGSATVTHAYAGPALEVGMYYQFRVTSFRDTNNAGRVAISTTEDLKGVFFFLGDTAP
jgi:hypothetical protein